MGRNLGAGLLVAAGLFAVGGCNGTARPMCFHHTNPEPPPCPCPPASGVPVTEGPILGDMPSMAPTATVVTPGMIPPGTVTIPSPGVTVPPAAAPPVGPQPRTAPTPPPVKPTT